MIPANKLLICLLIGAFVFSLKAQTVDDKLWVPDNPIYSSIRKGNTIYIGGAFTHLGPYTGYAASVDLNGNLNSNFPKINGFVYAIISDNNGGWYIGGIFSKIGDFEQYNIAHILSDGTVDESFEPITSTPQAWESVRSLALSEDESTLYIGGDFHRIGAQTRYNIAAVNASSGLLLSQWDPHVEGYVYSIQTYEDYIYVGGVFSQIGGEEIRNIGRIDKYGYVDPDWNPDANDYVFTLKTVGSILYVGGQFDQIAGNSRTAAASFDLTTGDLTNWNPNANSGSIIEAITSDGNFVYVGGIFSVISGTLRQNAARFYLSSGNIDNNWDPGTNGTVYSIATEGSIVYLGGAFTYAGGTNRSRIAAVSSSTGVATNWDPCANRYVFAIVPSSSNIYIGGAFNSLGGVDRSCIAALDAISW